MLALSELLRATGLNPRCTTGGAATSLLLQLCRTKGVCCCCWERKTLGAPAVHVTGKQHPNSRDACCHSSQSFLNIEGHAVQIP